MTVAQVVSDIVYELFCVVCYCVRKFKFLEDDGRDEVYVGECGHTKRERVR